jgi:hypothetical protein
MSSFSFVMEIAGFNPHQRELVDTLYEAGCSDALVVIRDERVLLDFDREAGSFDSAVASATRDVESAGGRVVRVDPVEA